MIDITTKDYTRGKTDYELVEKICTDNNEHDGSLLLFTPKGWDDQKHTKSEIKAIRKENRLIIKKRGFDANPGVYIHLSFIDDSDIYNSSQYNGFAPNTPILYAGQATHLGTRGANQVRIANKDLIILIKKSKNMDENWRQHLEHLLIKYFFDREEKIGIKSANKKGERGSFCTDDEKKNIIKWFKELKKILKKRKIHGFFESHPYPTEREIEVWNAGGRSFKVERAEYTKPFGRLKVPKNSFASKSHSSVDIADQEYKTELITSGILKPVDVEGKTKYYQFTKDHIFRSKTLATRVIMNNTKGWDAAGWQKSD